MLPVGVLWWMDEGLLPLFGLTAAGFTLFLWQRDRCTEKPAGYCVKCGYDLRASTKVCPECGMAIAPERK